MDADGPTDPRADAELLAAHVAGDTAAFGTLFARHRERLWAVALRTTADPELAADGLQDGMIAAFRRADSFRGEAQVTTWLHRIVVNACLDLLRRRAVRRTEPLPDDLDDSGRPPQTALGGRGSSRMVDEAADPADLQVRRERAEQVHAALGRLSDDQRAAVVLVDMEGYRVAEAAEILGCAVGTVKSRCSRARARLGVLLADLLADLPDGDTRLTTDGNRPDSPDVGPQTRRGPPAAPLASAD